MSVASLASSIVNFKSAQTAASIQIAVAAKSLDTQRAQGDIAVQLIDAAGQQAQAGAANGSATDTSRLLDVFA
ncbi:MAG: hypothetical protein ACE5F9_11200 [Phycisphaerae bacterium]